jgi:DNA-binding NtrC family response regulator
VERVRSPRVLVADDQPDVVEALRLLLKGAGFAVIPVGSPAAAEEAAMREELDVALLDMNYARDTTSGAEGLALIARLRAMAPELPIVVMTAWGSVGSAVEAMKRGARDYIEKPWQNERLLATVRVQAELRAAARQADRLLAEAARERKRGLPELIAVSRAMEPVQRLIERVAGSDANVLITGEHGTGKDVVARSIHAASGRSSQAFVPVNAGALADGVFESELFGHVKGAFTDAVVDRIGCFELADGGTLFLDEIGTMPAAQQAKLLRVLQSGEFQPVGSSRTRRADVRVVSATNVDVARAVANGTFREDLLYRLNTVEIALPALRDRTEDIAALAAHFLARKASRYGKTITAFSAEAMTALVAHTWPGNVRELEHVIERAVVLAEGATVTAADVSLRRSGADAPSIERMTLADAEAHLIRRALERTGSAQAAAEVLGLSRSALYRRLAALGIRVQE